MNCNLGEFELADMLRCSRGLRRASQGAASMEAAAVSVCRFLYDELGGGEERRACVLVRFYKTHAYGALPPELQRLPNGRSGPWPSRLPSPR